MNLICREILFGSPEYEASLALREAVLRKPLGLEWTAEERQKEERSIHVGCFAGEKLIGALVLTPVDEQTVRMRLVAIAPDQQRQGAGSVLVAFAEQVARKAGYQTMMAHARDTAVPFYEKHGYVVKGDAFIQVSIPHHAIYKQL